MSAARIMEEESYRIRVYTGDTDVAVVDVGFNSDGDFTVRVLKNVDSVKVDVTLFSDVDGADIEVYVEIFDTKTGVVKSWLCRRRFSGEKAIEVVNNVLNYAAAVLRHVVVESS